MGSVELAVSHASGSRVDSERILALRAGRSLARGRSAESLSPWSWFLDRGRAWLPVRPACWLSASPRSLGPAGSRISALRSGGCHLAGGASDVRSHKYHAYLHHCIWLDLSGSFGS